MLFGSPSHLVMAHPGGTRTCFRDYTYSEMIDIKMLLHMSIGKDGMACQAKAHL